MKIPSNRQWNQNNTGDSIGVLGDTTNMTLDTQGKARLARKAVSIWGSRDDNGFAYPLSINYFDDSYILLTSDDIFRGDFPNYTFTDAGMGSNPAFGLFSDAVVFNSLYATSITNKLYTWDGDTTWTDRGGSLTSGINHPLAVFGTQIAVGDGNTVKLFSTGYVLQITLTLPTEHRVVTMRSVGDYIYIGTKNMNGGNAKIYVWDGDSTLYNYEVEVGASWVFAMTEYLNSVAAITNTGQLGRVNGTTFEQLDALPVYFDPHATWQNSTGLQLNGKVFNRGIATIGDCIYLNIEGEVDSGFVPEMKSGIWVYDPAVGLYHRASASSDEVVQDTGLTRSGDVLTTTTAHKLKTGDAVCFDSVSALTGVNAEETYYVEAVSTTTIKLSQSRKALENGIYVTLGGTPGAFDILVYAENSDYSTASATSGAILPTTYAETPHPNLSSEILWGCRFDLPAGTAVYGLFSFTDSYNIGSFTTQRIYTDNIEQTWNNLYNFIDGLTLSNEEVVIKAQTIFEPDSTELAGVWLNSTTVNNNSTEDFSAWSDIEEGYEIVVIDGYGRGHTAHVSEINTSSSTISLVLDEAIGTANETCTLYYTTFKKVGTTLTKENKDTEKLKTAIMGLNAPWISLKVELRGFMTAANMMELVNVSHKSK
jgi:hypothetical protein